MKEYTWEEWLAEGERRFGDNFEDWEFICPACGRINKGKEFKEAGANPNDMYQTCIGRHNGKGKSGINLKSGMPAPEYGCDWAAFGLFGTLGKGNIVISEGGKRTEVFAFADHTS